MSKFVVLLFLSLTTYAAVEYKDFFVKGHVTIENRNDLRLRETVTNGTNFVALEAPASLSSDLTLTLPNSNGSANQFLQTNGSGVLSWATPGNTLSAPTALTSAYTATTSDDYLEGNTTSGAFTITLYAASGNRGRVLRIKNIGTANNLTIDGNGSETISGQANKILAINESIEIVCDGTNWRVLNFRGRGVVSITSSTLTPGGSGRYHALTGNSFTLSRGRWLISAKVECGNNGSNPNYQACVGVLSAANGNDTSTFPTNLTGVSNLSMVGTNTSYVQSITNPNSSVTHMPLVPVVVDITADTSGSIFVNAYSDQTTSSNARIVTYSNAWKIGD